MLMNKQEFIERMKSLKNIFGNKSEYIKIDAVIELASELDEPQKPVVPQFVADWIEECKDDDFHLFGAMEGISSNQKKLDYWFREDDNMELFARAWLDGYEVEEEELVKVRLKGTGQYLCNDETGLHFQHGFKTDFTKEYLEQANFGWVFDCPGIEIEEVKG
ncbi:DUF1642 domain-containing protein [Streptococcus parasanguinis]|uniref:DUF1642 domain-containing protein n=1 Tax=Streptococcus parasanguinis TaxID=1318 RepID=UPI00066B91E7|nr:DUF1642 domain-containing protein [Streptococcus parasanguinis]